VGIAAYAKTTSQIGVLITIRNHLKEELINMARTVFFSFHYQRDIMRVQQVKHHYVTKGNYTEAGFFDGSLEEKAKKEGDEAVKRLVNSGLNGCSVLCVLIGKETYTRRWVDYEILKSVELGMGVFGVRIHQLRDPKSGADTAGSSPFQFLGYGVKDNNLVPMIQYQTGWKDAPYLCPINSTAAPYLANRERPILSSIFTVHDWIDGDGYNNFGSWVEAAAKQAGR
jgi:hypothetical protein